MPDDDGYASRAEVEAATEQWPTDYLDCRFMRHSWARGDAVHVVRLRYYRASYVCTRCGTRKILEISDSGASFAQTYEYPDGYLAQGVGRIAGEGRDAIRLAAVLRGGVTNVRGKAKDSDLPRFGATRRAIEES